MYSVLILVFFLIGYNKSKEHLENWNVLEILGAPQKKQCYCFVRTVLCV